MQSWINPVTFFILVPIVVAVLWAVFSGSRSKYGIRRKHIHEYSFPPELQENIQVCFPHLNEDQSSQVIAGLRQYFLLLSGYKYTSVLPSKAVAYAWQKFVDMGAPYSRFCSNAFGRHLSCSPHFPPDGGLASALNNSIETRNSWLECCYLSGVDPVFPERLPLLFAIDAELAIPFGVKYFMTERPYTLQVGIMNAPSAKDLSKEIDINENENYLADKLRYYLNNDSYIKNQRRDDLAALFDLLAEHGELFTMVFGSYVMMEYCKDQMLKKGQSDGDVGCGCGCSSSGSS
jgi:hypothetical protein